MPTYAKFMKDLHMKMKIIMDDEIVKPQPQQYCPTIKTLKKRSWEAT